MWKTLWGLLLVFAAAPLLPGADPGMRAQIVGSTIADLPNKIDGRIEVTGEEALSFRFRAGALSIPYDRIHTLEYGQNVSRRYAEAILISPLLLLSKSRKHFVTIGYTDDNGHQQALIFRVEKGDVRALLAALEIKSGRRVEYLDDEARKSKG